MTGTIFLRKFVPVTIFLMLSGCSTIAPQSLLGLDNSISQAIIVQPTGMNSHLAQLSTWQRQGSVWHRRYHISAVIGRNGIAPLGQKKEGDGRTPSGIYPLGSAFGYPVSIDTGLPYRQATELLREVLPLDKGISFGSTRRR